MQEIIVYIVVAAAILYLIFSLVRTFRRVDSGGCCSGGDSCSGCEAKSKDGDCGSCKR